MPMPVISPMPAAMGGAFVHQCLEQGNHRKPCDHQPNDED